MRWPILLLIIGTMCLLNVPVLAEDMPARQTLKTELKAQPEMILNAGPNGEPADPSLVKGLHLFATLAVLDHNLKNKDVTALKKEMQDGVEVHYFVNDQRFPPGFRPAFAAKDGYLLLASSPEAVRRFEKQHIERMLRRVPDKKDAAQRLGMGLSSLYRRIAELGIRTPLPQGEG